MVRSKEMNDWLDEWSAILDENDIDVLGEREPMSIEMVERFMVLLDGLWAFQ